MVPRDIELSTGIRRNTSEQHAGRLFVQLDLRGLDHVHRGRGCEMIEGWCGTRLHSPGSRRYHAPSRLLYDSNDAPLYSVRDGSTMVSCSGGKLEQRRELGLASMGDITTE